METEELVELLKKDAAQTARKRAQKIEVKKATSFLLEYRV